MSIREVDFPPKDAGLRADVSTLGALVGDVIREQGGEGLFEQVEAARKTAIRRREGDADAERELDEILAGRSPEEAEELVRSFSSYFQVVNMAEKVHRIRRQRDHLRKESQPQSGSFEATLGMLRDAGVELQDLVPVLESLRVEPVFTAHPSEATRRSILAKQQRIGGCLVDRLDPSMTPPEERASLGQIRAEVTSAWQTEEHPSERPTIADEREHVLFYLTDIIYRVVPPFYEAFEKALEKVYGSDSASVALPVVLRFASWVGGDMDGNPNVTAETLLASLAHHRDLVLKLYRDELGDLATRLSQSLTRVGVNDAVTERIERYASMFPETMEGTRARHRGMPYRVLLRLMDARLQATARDAAFAYDDAETFVGDLRIVDESLRDHRGARAGAFAVRRALRRAETFGFHLATMDVRQDGRVLAEVMGQLLGDPDWTARSSDERTGRLRQALAAGDRPPAKPDERSERTLDVFRAIGECRRRYGPEAVGPYIISMARGPDDVLTVLVLARWAGLSDEAGQVPLDVAPLFETVADLEAAPRVMDSLLSDPIYAAHLEARGDRQTVMIGYSDSNKDGGLAASRWALQKAQAALVKAIREVGVGLTIFHGRGGTISRGGGKTHRAVMAAPEGAVDGHLRMTEQGEVIDAKYGLRGIAMRTLERTTGAVVLASVSPRGSEKRERVWHEMMEAIADGSRDAYSSLVFGDPDFFDYFRVATPIDVIERMAIGSRPPTRGRGHRIGDLRAIPWVFAWTQSRHLLPGWYGLGSGLQGVVEQRGEELVAEMVRDWPFLNTLIDDAEMVLAKADMSIAARYARLADAVGERIFERIRSEHARTVQLVTRLKGTSRLLDTDPTLQRSIRLRNPYVDPMSLLQIDLLTRWRATDREDPELFSALVATVNGIAQGLQNTG